MQVLNILISGIHKIKTSIIITTYNWPEALNLCVASFFKQTKLPYEIVIADDGSDEETSKCISRLQSESKVPIVHAWQEDKNFRAARARNLAVKKSSGDYLIFVDGDMIAHPNFVKDHISSAKEGLFLQGGRCLLNQSFSQELLDQKTKDITPFTKGIINRKNALRIPLFSKLVRSKTDPLNGIKTCNLSLFRSDFESINGFDNRFIGWGREDSEFAARLQNNKIIRKDLRFKALAFHIYHQENSRKSLAENHKRLMETIKESKVNTNDGYLEV